MGHDTTVAVNHEGFRNPAHIIRLAHVVSRIQKDLELISVLLNVRGDGFAPITILAHREDCETLILSELLVQGFNRGHFPTARLAPGCPQVKKYHFTAHRGERNFMPVEVTELEVACHLAGRDRARLSRRGGDADAPFGLLATTIGNLHEDDERERREQYGDGA